ncbi:MAG TPA: 6,7-dimethyl-8-ribityllumazine synthase [Candidatus Peribacteraceae bacterium]|nr:6,7-dimethyl-8-ribityllumazine synthase [Candidatus Peribacteraceae bacterium]
MSSDVTLPLPAKINPGWRIGIVHSLYHDDLVSLMVKSAQTTLLNAGIPKGNITLHPAAGAFEIPLIGLHAADSGQADALIGFGIIVEGETEHARLLAEQSARGIMDVQLQKKIPFAFEVLYVRSLDQAKTRCKADGGKGGEAAVAVLHSLAELDRLHS